ncbi:Ephrin_rec_like domain-containing protein [Pycnococcus provasolii]
MGYIEDMSCPSGFAEMDTSSRSGFRCVACDLVRILPLAECGSDGADEAKCCSGLAEWIWAGCLCDSNGVNLATSLGATEELALEGASACGFTMSSIPRPSARTCVQNITDELRMEQEQSSGAKAAATSLVAMVAVFVASQV